MDYIIENGPFDDIVFGSEDEIKSVTGFREGLLYDLYRGRVYTEEDIHAIPYDQVLEEWQQSGV